MNDTDHLFALSEMEQHKLDELKEDIQHPRARKARRYLGENAWVAIAISLAAGLLCGLACGRRG